ncbi:hypothetical protein VPHK397_0168 [Vibrio phage K397]|nr:hypothetical protein MYOV002v2_p0158 [Vibrio phage 144E46.1]
MKLIKSSIAGLRLNASFIKPMLGDTHCFITINKGEFQVSENGTITSVVESTNSLREWAVELGGVPATIGCVREYSDNMISITCTLENVELAKSILDEYMLAVELDKLRTTRSKLRQHQASVKLLSGRIESRKENK